MTFQYKNATASLLTLVVDAVVKELKKFVVTPIVSPRMEDTGVWYRTRMARDTCKLGVDGRFPSIGFFGRRICCCIWIPFAFLCVFKFCFLL